MYFFCVNVCFQSSASSSNFHYLLMSLKSPSSCLCLLPRLPVSPIFPSVTCFRRRCIICHFLFYLVCILYCGCFNLFSNVWVLYVWVFIVWVCVFVGFLICGCFGNMCACIYCVLVLFLLCIFILFMFLFNFVIMYFYYYIYIFLLLCISCSVYYVFIVPTGTLRLH